MMPIHKTWQAVIAAVALMLLTTPVLGAASGLPDFTELVDEYKDAVVNISTTQSVEHPGGGNGMNPRDFDIPEEGPLGDLFRRFFGEGGGIPPGEFDTTSLGSGFIFSSDGHIITNYHVVAEAEEITVRLSDRREFEAEVIGHDERSDLAVIKVDAEDLPVVDIGSSAELKVGEWVMAIGTPFGFEHSVSVGVVSAMGRSLPSDAYVPFIQTDVAINPGNSGGPLFNLEGEVIGINSQIYSRTGGFQGVSFAIPVDVAMDVVRDLMDKGSVSRGWLGVMIQDVDRDLAESFGMDKPEGALVARIMDEGPAADSDLEVGDVIVELEGEEVHNSSQLPPMVGSYKPGAELTMTVVRQGDRQDVRVTLGELPEQPRRQRSPREQTPDDTGFDRLGLRVENVPDRLRERLELEGGGVVIAAIEQGAAANAGLRRGDIISMLAGKSIRDAGHFAEVVEALPEGRRVPVRVHRGDGSPRFLSLQVPE
ncbi:MAG: Do family serine endopeptidase [Pseudomonadota bacterium]